MIDIIKTVNSIESDKGKQHRKVALAIGLLLGYCRELPSGPVDSSVQYFLATHKLNNNRFISYVNENLVFDVNAASDIAQAVWQGRYGVAFCPCDFAAPVFQVITNNSMFNLSQADIELIQENPERFSRLYTALKDHFCSYPAKSWITKE